MAYSALEDRPGVCEGCGAFDYPAVCGPSTKQITWNNVLGLWLCVDCRYSWSNWVNTDWGSDGLRAARKPGFLIRWEKEQESGKVK